MMCRSCLLVASLWPLPASSVVAVFDDATFPPFSTFAEIRGRSYARGAEEEYELRRSYYEQHAAKARLQNLRGPGRSWTAGVNDLWDWSDFELARLRGYDGDVRPERSAGGRLVRRPRATDFLAIDKKRRSANETHWPPWPISSPESLPPKKDYLQLHSLQRIHSQGGCGSCWAIAASTVLQAHVELHNSGASPRTFSAQHLVSCVPNPRECGGQGGCRGATIELALDWVLKHGCAEEHEVPYVAETGQCGNPSGGQTASMQGGDSSLVQPSSSSSSSASAAVGGAGAAFGMRAWERLPENRYEPLLKAVVEYGPVGVSVAATGWSIYSNGIFDSCPLDAIVDHAVVLVGYGVTDKPQGYWLIQNSWGSHWGEGGRIRLLRRDNDEAICGVDTKPELGSGCKGGLPQVQVCGMCGILYDSALPYFQ